MKKIAFCFLCKDRLKNISLWKKFFTGHEDKFNIYFHFSEKDITAHKDFFNRKIVPYQETSWGDINRAIFSLYKRAFNDDNFKYILLSESCIPVKNFLFTYESLTTDDKSTVMTLEETDSAPFELVALKSTTGVLSLSVIV